MSLVREVFLERGEQKHDWCVFKLLVGEKKKLNRDNFFLDF